MLVVNILGSIDDKIEKLNSTNDKLIKFLMLNFVKKYSCLSSEDMTCINNFSLNQISGDWGNDSKKDNYNSEVKCIRGADIPAFIKCNLANVPTRYILEKNKTQKKLKDYDLIVEMSGGSPTQSTGRTAIVSNGFVNNEDYICTNFCKSLRFENNQLAIYTYLLMNMWYDSKLFFNYEIGTTGLKNFNLEAVLNLDIKQPTNEFLNAITNIFNNSYSVILGNSKKINKLNNLKQLYLKKFFG